MKLHELQDIYPQAVLHDLPTEDPAYLNLTVGSQFLAIPKASLAESEADLLQLLANEGAKTLPSTNHPWFPALFENKKVPAKGRFRVLQVIFNRPNSTAYNDWNQAIKTMLPAIVDQLFISENRCLLIEEYSEEAFSLDELEGLFLALDGDLDTYTRVFIGSFYDSSCDFTQLLEEEEHLFKQVMTLDKQHKVFTLPQVVVAYFAQHKTADSYMMQQLFDSWFEEDLAQIITALWQNQGNVSSAAKELFMHRNSLQYKIDKFQKQTLINLKQMDHLFLCYLLLITFQ